MTEMFYDQITLVLNQLVDRAVINCKNLHFIKGVTTIFCLRFSIVPLKSEKLNAKVIKLMIDKIVGAGK